uniref:G-protein coupled receptors family 1 profile domain-containing protein n=1 Tax=Romanomermis culicivorax TaxID=13658 RepID=A0A915KQD5_ROMCU
MDNSSISDAVRFYRQLFINGLFCIIFLVGFCANLWVLYLATRKSKVKPITTILILNLATADFLMITCLPMVLAHSYAQDWVFGLAACKIYYTVDAVSKVSSISFLVLLSLDRYLAVCWPVKSKPLRTTWVAVGAAGVTWLLDSVIMAPVYLRATLIASEDPETPSNATSSPKIHCVALWSDEIEQVTNPNGIVNNLTNNGTVASTLSQRRIFTFYTFFLNYLLPLLLIWTFYLLILHRLSKRQAVLFQKRRRRRIQKTTLMNDIFNRLITQKKSNGSERNILIVQNERLCSKNGAQINGTTVAVGSGALDNGHFLTGSLHHKEWKTAKSYSLTSPTPYNGPIRRLIRSSTPWAAAPTAAGAAAAAGGCRSRSGDPKHRTVPDSKDKRPNNATAAECFSGGNRTTCNEKNAKIVADVVTPLAAREVRQSCRVFSVKFRSRSEKCHCGAEKSSTLDKNSLQYGVDDCSSVG